MRSESYNKLESCQILLATVEDELTDIRLSSARKSESRVGQKPSNRVAMSDYSTAMLIDARNGVPGGCQIL